ncbi:MAG: leucyl/phenylalanyl-tRNA--protein transferase, partial [Planctomycetes bacterium]|nr:leucyl/phenylalanyl-tRNA--protein transferase [Planctomycetota bacterium]
MAKRITPELVLNAYCAGVFPMGGPRGTISWHSPDPRCVFPLDRFHVQKKKKKTIRLGVFE